MRIIVEIPADLLAEAGEVAARRGNTLSELVTFALEQMIHENANTEHGFTLRKHSFGGEGIRSGLRYADWDTIRALAYEGRGG